jgi:hypothetical protein
VAIGAALSVDVLLFVDGGRGPCGAGGAHRPAAVDLSLVGSPTPIDLRS